MIATHSQIIDEFPACKIRDGTSPNSENCTCGLDIYDTVNVCNSSALYCEIYTETLNGTGRGACSGFPPCANTDGSSLNIHKCSCGQAKCKINDVDIDDLLFDGITKDCSQSYCRPGSLCFADDEACMVSDCGSEMRPMPNCLILNPRCTCLQCKKGFYSSDCSKICPCRRALWKQRVRAQT